MSGGTLYTYAGNFRAHKAQIAAQYSGRALRLDAAFSFGTSNSAPAFLAKFPQGKVPAFEGDDGLLLTESNAIAYYLSNDTLRGMCPAQSAQIQQWLSWADSEIFPSACAWVYPILGIKDVSSETKKHGEEDILNSLRLLNNHLLTKTFLVGERITLADIVVFCTLVQVFQYALDKKAAKAFPNVNRWFTTLMHQPEFKAVLGEIKLCEGSGDSAKEEQPAKQQGGKSKPAKAQEPKAPKAKAQPKAAEPEDEPEEEFKEAPSKNPFDDMPKGTFVMDNFKKVYSNESETVSIPYFFQNFDAENYSIWFGEYKYCDELAKVFMSCNLITGMFQRLDKMRKQAFASCCLFGKDDDSTISGVWVWRGQELVFPLCPDWQIDYESYSWKKLDFKSPETKALVEQYFSWTGKDKDGREFNQGKIFK